MSTSLSLTKYHQIYLVLREQLEDGQFNGGLPPELELARQFGVGRITVRRALEQLVNDGLIVRRAGLGTRPTRRAERLAKGVPAAAEHPATRLAGLLENLVTVSRSTSIKVLEWRVVPASEEMAGVLQVPVGANLRKIVRRRSTSAGPVSYITTYLPESRVQGFGRRELGSKALLQLLEEAGIELGRAVQTVSARQADDRVAAELGVVIGTALLQVRRLVYDADDKPVQLLHGLYRPDRYEYKMEISRVGGIDARIVAAELLP